MNSEKLYKRIKIINIIIICLFLPIMIIGSLYAISSIQQKEEIFNPLVIAVIGYLLAFIFGILAFKKNIFLTLSLTGWLIFGIGNHFDAKNTAEESYKFCLELRQDPNCVENEKGAINCKTGKHAGIYSEICKKNKE